jgi:hypothetical protein
MVLNAYPEPVVSSLGDQNATYPLGTAGRIQKGTHESVLIFFQNQKKNQISLDSIHLHANAVVKYIFTYI